MKNASLAAAVLLLGGCSLINSFDEVKPEVSDGGAGGSKNTGGSAAGGGGAASTGGAGGSLVDAGRGGSIDASTGGTNTGGSAGTGGAPDQDVFVPGGGGGAIVVYQSIPAVGKNLARSVVWVLDPKTGNALSEADSPNVVAIAQDPRTDDWYFFQTDKVAAATGTLVVKSLSLPRGRWETIGTLANVRSPAGAVSVLNGSLAYLSSAVNGATRTEVTIIATGNPAKPTHVTDLELDDTNANATLDNSFRLGLIPHANAGKPGGSLTVVLQENCVDPLCNIDLLRVTVDPSSAGNVRPDASSVTVGQINPGGGAPGFTFDSGPGNADVIFIPPSAGEAATGPTPCSVPPTALTGTVQEFDTSASHIPTTSPLPFVMGGARVTGTTFDPCQSIAFATGLRDPVVWAVPVLGAPPSSPPPGTFLCVNKPGSVMLYEPYTRSILRSANDATLASYRATLSGSSAPTLKQNQNFNTPQGFNIQSSVIAVRGGSPIPADAPTCAD